MKEQCLETVRNGRRIDDKIVCGRALSSDLAWHPWRGLQLDRDQSGRARGIYKGLLKKRVWRFYRDIWMCLVLYILLHTTAGHEKQCSGGINKAVPLTGESFCLSSKLWHGLWWIGRSLGSNDNEFLWLRESRWRWFCSLAWEVYWNRLVCVVNELDLKIINHSKSSLRYITVPILIRSHQARWSDYTG
jgi:hypothetical protein